MTEFSPSLKLLSHDWHLKRFLEDEVDTSPVNVEISPTNHCQAKCDWCFYVSSSYKQKHSKEELDWDLLESLIRDLSFMDVKAVTWTGGGDPSAYSHIDKGIAEAHNRGLEQGLFTNAYKAVEHPEYLKWIRVTITEKFLITKHVAEYAKRTKVGVNYNLCAENLPHLDRIAREARDAGVAYFQVRPALADRWDLQSVIPCPDYLKELETPDFRVVLTEYKWADYTQPHGYPVCHGHQFVPFVWHNGDVAVCAYHFGKPEYTFGNLNDNSFLAIWNGLKRAAMIKGGVAVIHDCQHCCKLHEINKPLAILSGEMQGAEDVNFL